MAIKQRLGTRQKKVLRMLLNGHFICVFKDLSKMEHEIYIMSDDHNDIYDMPKYVFGSLCKREMLEGKVVYTTTTTETMEFRIKPELVGLIKTCL